MLRAAALQLARNAGAAGGLPGTLEAATSLRGACPALTLTSLRCFSAAESPSSSVSSDGTGAAQGSAGSSGRPASKEWRTWVDAKLDSKLEALGQQAAVEEPPAAAVKAAEAPAAAASQPAEKRAKGWELEQQIYSIIAPPRPEQDATLPDGVTSYGQLAMASDAPRFVRASANVADISPQRLHPTRLFFPRTTYAPSELDPYKTTAAAAAGTLGGEAQELVPRAAEVGRYADYKNAPLLASFLSVEWSVASVCGGRAGMLSRVGSADVESAPLMARLVSGGSLRGHASLFFADAGKLPLRSRTHLRAKLHRHLTRQVKIARHMAILSPTERWRPEVSPEAAAAAAAARPQRRQAGHGGQPRPKQVQRPAA